MKFSEIIDRLNEGEAFSRYSSPAWAGKFIVKQIPQTVPAEVVPRMTSLPDRAKAVIGTIGDGRISYHDQVLIIEVNDDCSKSHATSYIPTWEDIFADDWQVL